MERRAKVALALGGGGARGLAHLGVLRVFERERIPIDLIVGTSIGSVAGGLYALEPGAEKIRERVLAYINSDRFQKSSFRRALPISRSQQVSFFEGLKRKVRKHVAYQLMLARTSLFKQERLYRAIGGLVGGSEFKDTQIPFYATALDLISGREVILSHGRLVDAMVASSSLPGFFPPFRADGMMLADMGVICAIPILAALRLGADVVIAVDLSSRSAFSELYQSSSVIDEMLRMANIGSAILEEIVLEKAHLVIRPEVEEVAWADFSRPGEIVERGALAAERHIAAARRLAGLAEPDASKATA
jgi:NTE family protein